MVKVNNFGKFARIVGLIGAITSLTIFVLEPSFPTPDKLVVFATFIFMIFGQGWQMLKQILPFVGLLLVYESFRGIVPSLNGHVNYLFLPDADKFLTAGNLPTQVLQNLWWHGYVQWYDFVFYLTYMLHFVLPFALALIVWKLKPQHYWRYITAFLAVSFAGFITYLLFPAAPPWMSSDLGLIEPVTRVSSDVWQALGVQDFPSIYNKIAANPVAAFPSLHAAYATLFALFVTTLWKSRWRWLSWVYPFLIYLGTIYMGEHYLIDEIAGAAYAIGVFLAAPYILRCIKRVYQHIKKGPTKL